MGSDNPSGADDQQERLAQQAWLDAIPADVGNYIAGFVDGEGSFNVPIRREHDRSLPLRVGLSFNVSQRGDEAGRLLLQTFEVGTLRDRGDGIFYYEVTRPADLGQRVFPFFDRFRLHLKVDDLAVFRDVTALVEAGQHLTREGIETIIRLRSPMNRGGKRRRSDGQLIALLGA